MLKRYIPRVGSFLPKKNKRSRLSQSGMTLLEVLVALAIFSLSGLALMGSVLTASTNIERIKTLNEAGWVSENVFVSLKANAGMKDNHQSGEEKMGTQTYLWKKNYRLNNENNHTILVVDVYAKTDLSQRVLRREYDL